MIFFLNKKYCSFPDKIFIKEKHKIQQITSEPHDNLVR